MSANPSAKHGPNRAASPPVERRSALRVAAEGVRVTVQIGSTELVGDVMDVSRGGLRIAVACPPILGTSLTVRHAAAGSLTGSCVRQTEDEIAIAFDRAENEVERTLQCLALLLG